MSTLPNGSYGSMSGTSMATPYVAAAAALVWSQNPSLTSAQVKQTLMDTADKVAAFGGRSVSGGRLNAGRAVGSTVLPVAFTYTGFGGAVAGTPITGAANVSVDAPSRLPSGTISMRVTLATKFGSQVYGVAGQALRYAFNSGEQ